MHRHPRHLAPCLLLAGSLLLTSCSGIEIANTTNFSKILPSLTKNGPSQYIAGLGGSTTPISSKTPKGQKPLTAMMPLLPSSRTYAHFFRVGLPSLWVDAMDPTVQAQVEISTSQYPSASATLEAFQRYSAQGYVTNAVKQSGKLLRPSATLIDASSAIPGSVSLEYTGLGTLPLFPGTYVAMFTTAFASDHMVERITVFGPESQLTPDAYLQYLAGIGLGNSNPLQAQGLQKSFFKSMNLPAKIILGLIGLMIAGFIIRALVTSIIWLAQASKRDAKRPDFRAHRAGSAPPQTFP